VSSEEFAQLLVEQLLYARINVGTCCQNRYAWWI